MTTESMRLSQLATIVQGGRHGLSGNHFVEPTGGYPAFGAGGLNGYLATYEFDQPAVVLSSIGARCGKCFLVNGRWSSLANTQVILPDLSRTDVRFLWYQLNDETSWVRSGTAQPFIKPSTVKARTVLVPPLAEQRRIADVLDKADAVRRKRKEAVALSDELLRSAFLEMFGDPVANPKAWRRVPFEEAVRDATGGNPKVQQGDYQQSGAYPVIDQGADFVGGWTDDRTLVASARLPAVLFGDHTKALKWVDGPFVLGADGVKILEAGPLLTPEFLYTACSLFPFPSVGYSRHFKFLKLWSLPVPPLHEQQRFAGLFRRVRSTLPRREEAAAHADRLFACLVASAFTSGLPRSAAC